MAFDDTGMDRLAATGVAAVVAGLVAPWLPWRWQLPVLFVVPLATWLSFGSWPRRG